MASFTSTQTGTWSDGATWGNTSPGVAGTDYPWTADTATISSGHTVTYDNDNSATAGFGAISITGTLSIDTTQSTHMKMNGNITLQSGGTFNCGSEGSPLSESYTFDLEFNCDTTRTLYGIEDNGTCYVDIHGSTPSAWTSTRIYWDTINGAMTTSDTTLVTDNTTGWSVGDELYIFSDTDDEYDRVTIDSISGTNITLTSGTTYAHPDGAIVHNISRNIRVYATSNSYETYIRIDNSTASIIRFTNVLFDTLGGTNYPEYGIWLRADQGSYLNDCVLFNCNQSLTANGLSADDGLILTNTCIFDSRDKGIGGGGVWQIDGCWFVQTQDKAINDGGMGDNSYILNSYFMNNGIDMYGSGLGVVMTNNVHNSFNGVNYDTNNNGQIYMSRTGTFLVKGCTFNTVVGGEIRVSSAGQQITDISEINIIDYNATTGDQRTYKTGNFLKKDTTTIHSTSDSSLHFEQYEGGKGSEWIFDIPVTSTGTLTLDFWYKFNTTGDFDTTRTVEIYDEDGNTDSVTLTNSSTSWQNDTSLSLSVVAGEYIKIRISLEDTGTGNILNIDDISYGVV